MATNKKPQTPAQSVKGSAKQKRAADPEPEKPEEFEEQRSTALRMKKQPLKQRTNKGK